MDIITAVVSCILTIESANGTDLRSGDDGRAVGPFQMWTIAVDEANRIDALYANRFGRKPRVWTYDDRNKITESRDMCVLTLLWHYYSGVTDAVDLACRWNRPDGSLNQAYRDKVIAYFGAKPQQPSGR